MRSPVVVRNTPDSTRDRRECSTALSHSDTSRPLYLWNRRSARLALGILLTVATACAPAAEPGQRRTDSSRITQEEMAAVEVFTLYDVVDRLRPHWLRIRSDRSFQSLETAVAVYQNQTYLGGPAVLRDFSKTSAYELRYLDGSTASNVLPGVGSRHLEGAIIILTSPDVRFP